MISNYSKTMELVNAANNSAGASQEQYGKTLDSVKTKLAKLKNAWDEFTMSLSNNELIQHAIGALTGLLTTINKIINTLSGGSGVVKSILGILTAIGGLRLGKSLLETVTDKVSGGREGGLLQKIFGKKPQLQAEGMQAGQATGQGFKAGFQAAIKGATTGGFKEFFTSGVTRQFTQAELQKEFSLSQLDFSSVNDKEKRRLMGDYFNTNIRGTNISQEDKNDLLNSLKATDIDGFNAKLNTLGMSFSVTGQRATAAGASFKQTGVNLSAIATAAGVASTALFGLASWLETTGSGGEKAAGVIRGFATILMGLIPVIQMVQNAMVAGATTIGAAISSIPIIGWITTIISAVIGLVQVFKTFAPETEAEKVKRLAEQQKKLEEGASATKEAYDGLKSSLDSLSESEKTLDNLIKGTREWKVALLDVNNQVLELIKKYPQLKYEVDDLGQLSITDDSIEAALDYQVEAMKKSQAALAVRQLEQSGEQGETLKRNLIPFIEESMNYEERSDAKTNNIINNIMLALSRHPDLFINNEALKALSEQIDIASDVLQANSEKILEYYNFKNTEDGKMEEYGRQLFGNFKQVTKYKDNDDYKFVVDNLTKYTQDNITRLKQDELTALTSGSNDARMEELAKELKSQEEYQGLITDTSGNLLTYQQVFAALSGNDLSWVKENYQDEDILRDEIAELNAIRKIGEGIDGRLEILANARKVDSSKGNKLAALMSQSGENLTEKEATELRNLVEGKATPEIIAKALGIDITGLDTDEEVQGKLMEAIFGKDWEDSGKSYDDLIDLITVVSGIDFEGLKDVSKRERAREVQQNYTSDNMQYNEQKAVADEVNKASSIGEDAVNALDGVFSKITELGGDDFSKIIETMDSYDFSKAGQFEEWLAHLEDLGYGQIANGLRSMTNGIEEAYGAVRTFSLDNFVDEIKSALDFADEIEGKDLSEGLTFEEVEKIIEGSDGALSYDDFVFTGQEFLPINNSMLDLANAIRENTRATLESTKAELDEAIENGNNFKDRVDYLGTALSDEQRNDYLQGNASVTLVRGVTGDTSTPDEELMANYKKSVEDYNNLVANTDRSKTIGNYLDQSLVAQGNYELSSVAEETMDNIIAAKNLEGEYNRLVEQVKIFNEEAKGTGKEINYTTKLMKALTLATADGEEKVTALCDAVVDVKDAFDKGTTAIKKGETPATDYYEALKKITSYGKEAFGEGFTEEFVENNPQIAEWVSDLAKGGEVGEQAFKKIQAAIAEQAMPALENFLAGVENSQEILAAMEEIKMQLEMTGVVDLSQVMSGLNLTEEKAQELISILSSILGFKTVGTLTTRFVTLQSMGLTKEQAVTMGWDVVGNKVRIFDSFTVGTRPTYTGPSGGGYSGGGGGGGGSSKNWENPYDKLYNLTEEINEALRQREKMEREYDRILSRRGSTIQELAKNYNQQLTALKYELELQKQLQAGRKEQIEEVGKETHIDSEGNATSFDDLRVSRFARYDETNGRIIINWDEINKITDEDLGSAIEEYVSRLEELQSQFEDTDEKIEDIEDSIEELKKDKMQDYLDFESRIYEAVLQQRQTVIDNFQTLSDEINESNTSVLDSLQESIDLERQIRDNTKTEQDINEKEARLAYLRRDTSNANALEIKQLEEELSQAREDYADTLVDQKLEELRDQNDKAQEAREKQIELMQAALDWEDKNGRLWSDVYDLINGAIAGDGNFKINSDLVSLLKETEGFGALSNLGKINWSEELAKAFLAALHGQSQWEQYLAENNYQSATLSDKKTNLHYISSANKWVDDTGSVYTNVRYNSKTGYFDGTKQEGEDSNLDLAAEIIKTVNRGDVEGTRLLEGIRDNKIGNANNPPKTGGEIANILQEALNKKVETDENYDKKIASAQSTSEALEFEILRNRKLAENPELSAKYPPTNNVLKDIFSGKRVFKTGGLAAFTGPAWLDGTRSKPELVLNAQDTENFLTLRDTLGSLAKNTGALGQVNGDNYFDIKISVDEISSDYDVDKMANRIKQIIVEDSTYRNVNALNFIR